MSQLKTLIEHAYESRENFSANTAPTEVKQALEEVLLGLESGALRVAENIDGEWKIHSWLKQAILLYFKLQSSRAIEGGFSQFYDKIPLRFQGAADAVFNQVDTRVVPPASVRRGAYIGPKTILMPSFVNIGAYVGGGTLVDTWATVGSCAQIGKKCAFIRRGWYRRCSGTLTSQPHNH